MFIGVIITLYQCYCVQGRVASIGFSWASELLFLIIHAYNTTVIIEEYVYDDIIELPNMEIKKIDWM